VAEAASAAASSSTVVAAAGDLSRVRQREGEELHRGLAASF
jgi:hypothetical protein